MYPQNWSPNSLTNRELLARTLEAEAGNQGLGGMIAVGAVIRNRTGSGQSIRDTILAPGQFSAWNSWTKYMDGAQGQNMAAIKPSADAYSAADSVLSNGFEDITGGATHYYNPDLANPVWGQSAGGNWKTIGSHVFGIPEGEQPNPRPTGGDNPVVQNTANNSMGSQPMSQQVPEQGFLGKLASGLADPRTRAALTSMSRTQLGRRLNEVAQREVGQNRTAQWLMTQEGGRPYAEAIMNGSLSADQAYSQWLNERNKTRQTKEVDGKLIDTETGEVIYEADPNALQQLNKDQNAIVNQQNAAVYKLMKPYNEIFNAYGQISRAIANQKTGTPSGVNDLVISISFSKLLDPESVVRAEESAAVNAAGGGVQAAFGGLKNFLDGTGSLSDPVRNTIMSTTQQTADTWYKMVTDERERALRQLELSGIPRNISEQVLVKPKPPEIQPLPVGDGNGEGEGGEQPNGPVPIWAAPLTQEQWDNLTTEKVQELTEAARREGKI
jgi:N-acetylmuramoyl-L-alanine amidase